MLKNEREKQKNSISWASVVTPKNNNHKSTENLQQKFKFTPKKKSKSEVKITPGKQTKTKIAQEEKKKIEEDANKKFTSSKSAKTNSMKKGPNLFDFFHSKEMIMKEQEEQEEKTIDTKK